MVMGAASGAPPCDGTSSSSSSSSAANPDIDLSGSTLQEDYGISGHELLVVHKVAPSRGQEMATGRSPVDVPELPHRPVDVLG